MSDKFFPKWGRRTYESFALRREGNDYPGLSIAYGRLARVQFLLLKLGWRGPVLRHVKYEK